jgi:hypothetical protein
MTRLQEEILQEISRVKAPCRMASGCEHVTNLEKSKVCAEVIKRWIEKAGNEIGLSAQKQIKDELPQERAWRLTEEWMKENGVL